MTGSQRIENDLGKVDSIYSFMTGLINDDVEKYCPVKVSETIRTEFEAMCKAYKLAMYNIETVLDEGGWADV